MKKTLTYHLFPGLLLIFFTLLLYLLWRSNSPYPYPLNWDIWEHQTVINNIRNGFHAILPSALSDTFRFDGYTTLFHELIAAIQQLFSIQDILGFWWITEGVFYVLTGLATYLFTYSLTKNRLCALTGGILSACFFESSMAYTTLFFIPQTLVGLLWVIGMSIITFQTSTKNKFTTSIFISILLILLHGIIGTFGAILLIFYALGLTITKTNIYIFPLLWFFAPLIGYVIPAYIAQIYNLGSINSGEAQYFTQTISQKLILFRQWYGWLPIPFFILGLWSILKSEDIPKKILVILFGLIIGFLMSPFPYVLKFVVLFRYILIVMMTLGIALLLKQFHSRLVKYFLLTILTVSGIFIFYTNTEIWKKPIFLNGIASHVSPDEQQASTALKEHYRSTNAFLISDPATQYILETLSGINSQGGAYMDIRTRKHIAQAFGENQKSEFLKDMSLIEDLLTTQTVKTKLLVINSRTLAWLEEPEEKRNSISFNIWRPDGLSIENELTIESWKQKFELNEVYRNGSIVIFELPIL